MALRVLLVAGEASGDLHGAALLQALRRRAGALEAWGIGGPRLQEAGMRLLVDMRSVSTMGFVETFGTIGRIFAAYRRVVRSLDEERPHLLVLIDYPEFNLRLARQAKRRGIPVFYFIAPQVWAWRRGRVRRIKRLVDRMAVVFPFEPRLYNNGGTIAEFVGHPLLDVVAPTRSREETRSRYNIDPGARLLAILPGSRRKEIRYLLGPLCAAAAKLTAEGWRPVIALAASLNKADLKAGLDGVEPSVPIAEEDTYNVLAAADAAVVASGTATLEAALLGCPSVIVYRMAPLTHWLARRLVRVEWIGMPNIILEQRVLPELIQAEATPEAIAEAVRGVARRRSEIASALALLRGRLGSPGAAERAAALALDLVSHPRAEGRETEAGTGGAPPALRHRSQAASHER